ncbi:MAG: signal peptidase I [Candidatus Portnoybacteria bacterium]|nr:signal peptidase I [Candidatus Portnoybacteria bacterium]
MRKIFKAIYYIFIVAIAMIAILLLVSAFPIPGNLKALTVLSGSMEPAIKTGSIVLVKPSSEYGAGDIITFGKTSKTQIPTTHRIVEVKNNGNIFITKGDANENADTKEIKKSEIIGKVLLDVPYAGYAVASAKKPIGFLFIIVIPALIIIFDEVVKIVREIKKLKIRKLTN